VVLIAMATVAIAGASTYYLRPWVMLRPTSNTASIPRPTPREQGWVQYTFLNAALGWAMVVSPEPAGDVGAYAVLKTVDGAKHWEKRLEGRRSLLSGATLQFVDRSTGFVAVGDPLELRRTTDGGEHWTAMAVPGQGLYGFGFRFLDQSNGWLFTGAGNQRQHLFASHDGGATWAALNSVPEDIGAPEFRSLLEGWAGSSGSGLPHVYKTSDGGATWERRDLPDAPKFAQEDQVSTWVTLMPQVGVIAGAFPQGSGSAGPYGYRSLDERTWTPLVGPTLSDGRTQDALGSVFQDATHWWVAVGPDLYKTADRGDTWFRVDTHLLENLYVIQVLDSRHAWGQTFSGLDSSGLVFTADGGLHWTTANPPSRQ
jgi:photosystem II stability/assembly factor-like uncharacterized protein